MKFLILSLSSLALITSFAACTGPDAWDPTGAYDISYDSITAGSTYKTRAAISSAIPVELFFPGKSDLSEVHEKTTVTYDSASKTMSLIAFMDVPVDPETGAWKVDLEPSAQALSDGCDLVGSAQFSGTVNETADEIAVKAYSKMTFVTRVGRPVSCEMVLSAAKQYFFNNGQLDANTSLLNVYLSSYALDIRYLQDLTSVITTVAVTAVRTGDLPINSGEAGQAIDAHKTSLELPFDLEARTAKLADELRAAAAASNR